MKSNTSSSFCSLAGVVWLLLLVTAVQWALISYLLNERSDVAVPSSSVSSLSVGAIPGEGRQEERRASFSVVSNRGNTNYEGVAAAIFFSAPTWFHRRYPVLIQNALVNTPRTWAIQLFVNPIFWKERVLPYHPGLGRLLEQNSDRIVITELPKELQKLKKPNQNIPLQAWFWKSLLADRVLMWSANGIFCTHGNTEDHWQSMLEMDYIGVPWTKLHRVGGDGSTHSYRNRTLMLQALDYAHNGKNHIKIEPPDSTFFVSTLLKMKDDPTIYTNHIIRLATREDTLWFGGVNTTDSDVKGHARPIPPPPMVVSGTQAHLSFQHREDLLLVCPELKVIFPTLHEPTCFGAHPNPDVCRSTICALRDPLPSSGC